MNCKGYIWRWAGGRNNVTRNHVNQSTQIRRYFELLPFQDSVWPARLWIYGLFSDIGASFHHHPVLRFWHIPCIMPLHSLQHFQQPGHSDLVCLLLECCLCGALWCPGCPQSSRVPHQQYPAEPCAREKVWDQGKGHVKEKQANDRWWVATWCSSTRTWDDHNGDTALPASIWIEMWQYFDIKMVSSTHNICVGFDTLHKLIRVSHSAGTVGHQAKIWRNVISCPWT